MTSQMMRRSGSGRAQPRSERRAIQAGVRFSFAMGERARWYVLLTFVAMIALGGGGARHDVASLMYLRPLTFGFMAYAVIIMRPEERRSLPLPFYLLLALAALIAIQLIPLPPRVWSALPQRALYLRIGADAGLPELWRPLSLAPARTWNTLFSLGVPITAFLLYAVQAPQRRPAVLYLIIAVAVASVAMGLLQSFGGPDSFLYLYRITNVGDPVGLFANRNHEGVVLAVSIVACALAIRDLRPQDRGGPFKAVLLLGFIVLLIPFVLILGSRAGSLLSASALLIAPWFIFSSAMFSHGVTRLLGRGKGRALRVDPRFIAWAFYGLLVLGIVALALFNSRDEALTRLSDPVPGPIGRDAVFPYLVQMARDFMPWGAGFGTFDALFYQYEPARFISDIYLNQAHDDFLQLLIEGGLPAAGLLLLFAGWLGWQAVKTLRSLRSPGLQARVAMLAVLFMFGIASAVDYPLRVPICMMVAVFAVCLLAATGKPADWKRQ